MRPSLSWSTLVFGSMATWMTGSGNSIRSGRPVGAIAEGVAGGHVLEAETGNDVAGHGDVEVFALVGVHQEEAPDALALLLRRVVDLVALVDRAGVPGSRSTSRAGSDTILKASAAKEPSRRRAARRAISLDVRALGRRDVERRWQVVDHRVEHRLDTLVLGHRPRTGTKQARSVPIRSPRRMSSTISSSSPVLLHQLLVLGGDDVELGPPLLRPGSRTGPGCRRRRSARPSRTTRPRRAPSS